MQPRGSITHATSLAGVNLAKPLCSLLLLIVAICATAPLHAQDASPPSQQPLYTLHLDTRMAQIPTLMLNYGIKPLPLFDPQRVDITINNGHKFHPTHVRFEGDDPISLAILLDVSFKDTDFTRPFAKDFSRWIATSFKPHDRVSIYSLDCELLRTANNQPPNPSLLQYALNTAITSPLTHGKKMRPACGNSVRLRGAMDYIMQQLAPLPGRHVLFVLSTGFDGGSPQSWHDLWYDSIDSATTIFGMHSPAMGFYSEAVSLDNLARQSGGLLFRTTTDMMPNTLTEFVSTLRHRQILEFPIPLQIFGNQMIEVTIEHANVEALPSGIPLVPIPEAPATIPAPPESAPPAPQP